jgi:hypothetical protein
MFTKYLFIISKGEFACLKSQLLGRKRLGGQQFKTSLGKKLPRPHLYQ